jgi:TldD protein
MARELSARKKRKIKIAPSKHLGIGNYFLDGYDELQAMTWEEKFKLVLETEAKLRQTSQKVESSSCQYSEIFEEKMIVTTDGADSHMRLVRPEFRLAEATNQPELPEAGSVSFAIAQSINLLMKRVVMPSNFSRQKRRQVEKLGLF